MNLKAYISYMMLFLWGCVSYSQDLLNLEVKDTDQMVSLLKEKLDDDTHYIIEAMAFWCVPCLRSMDEFTYHRSYWKERFNTDIILLEDESYNDLAYVINEMAENEWSLPIYLSDGAFDSLGITSFPRYYFKEAGVDSVYRIYGSHEKFLLETVDSIVFSSIWEEEFTQQLSAPDCEELSIDSYSDLNTYQIAEHTYHKYGDLLLREDPLNGDLIKYNEADSTESYHLRYSTGLCLTQSLRDKDDEEITVKIMDRYQIEGRLHLLTDQYIQSECSQEDIPFIIIQGIGSNAGIDYDIEEGKIVSRLICHQQSDTIAYADESLAELCAPVFVEMSRLEHTFLVYPNPNQGIFYLFFDVSAPRTISIYDASGMVVYTNQSKLSTIEVNYLDIPTGLYLVKVDSAMGTSTQKVIISR